MNTNKTNGIITFFIINIYIYTQIYAFKLTQVSHDSSFDRCILTVFLQVDYTDKSKKLKPTCRRNVTYLSTFISKCNYTKHFSDLWLLSLSILPFLGSMTSSMLGTGVGSSMSLVRSSSGSSSCCPRLLLCTHINAEKVY